MGGRGEVIFLHGSHRPACIASVDKRFDYHVLQFMARGAVEVFYDDQRHLLRGAWTWPCWPGARVRFHEWPRGRAWDHRYIAFTGPLATEWQASGLLVSQPQPIEKSALREFERDFDRLLNVLHRADEIGKRLAQNLLENLLLVLAAARGQATSGSTFTAVEPWLAEVLRQMDAADEVPDYAALAESVGMSISTFRRRFRAATGVAVHQYLTQRRLLRARDLLTRGELTIKQIAHETGYRDVYYFTRHFRQVFKVPPGRYRSSVQD